MVTVITCTKRPEFLPLIFQNFENQTIEEKELVLVLHGFSRNLIGRVAASPLAKILELPEAKSLGSCLNEAISHAKYDVIARFDDDDYYGAHYLAEAVKTLEEKGAEVVGKQSLFVYFKENQLLALLLEGKEHMYIEESGDSLAGSTLVFKKSVAEKVKFPSFSVGEDEVFVKECKNEGIRMYASSPDHYVYIRYTNSHHSSDSNNERIKRHCIPLVRTENFPEFFTLRGGWPYG
ncbi:glycosyltransferase family 2 protein [Bacillus sp. FJAT-27445]|uniref:glycosyltransferase n=1 Tax=Bacillus sp. FJAT-27445 TaxID=1679166 RepID=UPI0007434C66|nr:glycosyltransferase [Bacillus sp. FJAT-27445]